ncbi:hypothetical protein F4859DRAFT_484296 [Xylaria cf. heliscus]|nr:hypothetical protein F4859DRAFT_484296 [Xylaria cf. heliscus]
MYACVKHNCNKRYLQGFAFFLLLFVLAWGRGMNGRHVTSRPTNPLFRFGVSRYGWICRTVVLWAALSLPELEISQGNFLKCIIHEKVYIRRCLFIFIRYVVCR